MEKQYLIIWNDGKSDRYYDGSKYGCLDESNAMVFDKDEAMYVKEKENLIGCEIVEID
jgi:hypothetical protein